MNPFEFLARLTIGVAKPNAARFGPSPTQEREHKRILAHRARNWPGADPWPPAKHGYLPPLRKGGGQRGVRGR